MMPSVKSRSKTKSSQRGGEKADGCDDTARYIDYEENSNIAIENSPYRSISGIPCSVTLSMCQRSRYDIAQADVSVGQRPPSEHRYTENSRNIVKIGDSSQATNTSSGGDEAVVDVHVTSPSGAHVSPVDAEGSDTAPIDINDEPEDESMTSEMGYSSGGANTGCLDSEQPGHADRSGVVFCSRIPPFMSLSKMRSYFSRYGKIGRIYAEPESLNEYKRRVKMGGNKKLKFIHGWIEFIDKSVAKSVAMQLNGQPVGEKKRHNFWRDDLWNLLYLPKYKFNDVMAYLREHKNDRKEKLSFHLANSRKENYNYMEQLEAEKQHRAIERRRQKQGLLSFKHKARIRSKGSKSEVDDENKGDDNSEGSVPMGLLGAIVT